MRLPRGWGVASLTDQGTSRVGSFPRWGRADLVKARDSQLGLWASPKLKDVKAAYEILHLAIRPPRSIPACIHWPHSLCYLVLDSSLALNFLNHQIIKGDIINDKICIVHEVRPLPQHYQGEDTHRLLPE